MMKMTNDFFEAGVCVVLLLLTICVIMYSVVVSRMYWRGSGRTLEKKDKKEGDK